LISEIADHRSIGTLADRSAGAGFHGLPLRGGGDPP